MNCKNDHFVKLTKLLSNVAAAAAVALLSTSCSGALAGGTISLPAQTHQSPNPVPAPKAGANVFDTVVCAIAAHGDHCDQPIAGVTVKVHTCAPPRCATDTYDIQVSDANGYNVWTEPDSLPNSDITFTKDGYLPQTVGVLVKELVGHHNIFQLYQVRPPLPAPPTRSELCAIQTTFQGLTVQTDQFGAVPWLDYYVTSPDVTPADRQRSYAAKHARGDTHQSINVSWAYREGGLVFAPTGRDLTNDLPTLRAFVREAIVNGFKVDLVLAGDGDSLPRNPDGTWPYNDPVGDTYGHAWLMANFQRLYDSQGPSAGDAEDLHPFIIWRPGYDGVAPTWQPWSEVDDWLVFARSVVGPQGALSLELGAGFWAWSGERDDYSTPAGMNLDTVMYEFPWQMGPPALPPANFTQQPPNVRAPWDQVWQVSKRLLGSAYQRPPEQPADDDPGHAPDLSDTPRGPRFKVGYEYDTYGWVRGLANSVIETHRAYLRAIGWGLVG